MHDDGNIKYAIRNKNIGPHRYMFLRLQREICFDLCDHLGLRDSFGCINNNFFVIEVRIFFEEIVEFFLRLSGAKDKDLIKWEQEVCNVLKKMKTIGLISIVGAVFTLCAVVFLRFQLILNGIFFFWEICCF